MSIYAIKGVDDNNERLSQVYESLLEGTARFGYSYVETADLRELKKRIETDGWESLSEDEKACYYPFLLEIVKDDYVIYINMPTWGECTLAKVTGEYYWRIDDEDFNHRIPVDPDSVKVFDRNDEIVWPELSARLKLRGSWWTIYTEEAFYDLLRKLVIGASPASRSSESDLNHLQSALQPLMLDIVIKINKNYPNKGLEEFLKQVFERVPGVRNVRHLQGRSDKGADLVVDFEMDSIPGLKETIVVQVKSYSGTIRDVGAVDDIKRAFQEHKEATMGLIISTAEQSSEEVDKALEELMKKTQKNVTLLIGYDLARFVVRYGGDLLVF